MKLIHTLSAFDVFGPEKTVLNECAELSRAGWETEVVNFWHEDDIPIKAKALARGVAYSCIVSSGRFDPAAIRSFVLRLQDAGRPLVHSHGYKADIYSLFAARLATLWAIPVSSRYGATHRARPAFSLPRLCPCVELPAAPCCGGRRC